MRRSLAALGLVLAGCATVINDQKETIAVSSEPAGAVVVAPLSGLEQADGHEPPAAGGHDSDVHLAVVAGTNEASDDMDQWVQALDSAHQQAGQGGEHDSDSLIADSSQQESRHP